MAKNDDLRAYIVGRVWTGDLRAELVDRIVDAVTSGMTSQSELTRKIDEALRACTRYKETNGRGGTRAPWIVLTAWLKRVYAANGRVWEPTAAALEPRPAFSAVQAAATAPTPPAGDEAAMVTYRDQNGAVCTRRTYLLTQDAADKLMGELCNLRLSQSEILAKIQEFAECGMVERHDDWRAPARVTFADYDHILKSIN